MTREELLTLAETLEMSLPPRASTSRIRALLRKSLFDTKQINSGPFPPQSNLGLLVHFLNEAEEPLSGEELVEQVVQYRLNLLSQEVLEALKDLQQETAKLHAENTALIVMNNAYSLEDFVPKKGKK
jgi:hypothetical protein